MIKNMDNPMVIFWLDQDHDDCGMWKIRNILIASGRLMEKAC
jgi:hypothetical protein